MAFASPPPAPGQKAAGKTGAKPAAEGEGGGEEDVAPEAAPKVGRAGHC